MFIFLDPALSLRDMQWVFPPPPHPPTSIPQNIVSAEGS